MSTMSKVLIVRASEVLGIIGLILITWGSIEGVKDMGIVGLWLLCPVFFFAGYGSQAYQDKQ